jgi:hypothetical protein
MTRKATALPAEVERARLLALLAVYDAIEAAAQKARAFYAVGEPTTVDHADFSVMLFTELRNQAVTLTALAPTVERAPTPVDKAISNMYLSMFPGLADLPIGDITEGDGP